MSRVEKLLQNMREGDREAAARFITTYGSRVRRRIRGKLGPTMRRLFDSQEILSTVGRRLDRYVSAGKLQATEESQLWSLIFRMAENALVDKTRVLSRLRDVTEADSAFANELLNLLESADRAPDNDAEIEIDNALRALDDPTDRQILSFWLVGRSHVEIADVVDLSPAAVRKRWQAIKAHLREHIQRERES